MIARLLLHFWAPADLPESARKAMAEDWLADLREFGSGVVSEACGAWRRAQTKRPTIADVRSLCLREQAERREHHALLPGPRCTEEDARRTANAWAQKHGYSGIDAYQADTLEGRGAWVITTDNQRWYFEGRKVYVPPPSVEPTARSLGALATEWKPTPEALERGLAELRQRGDIQHGESR